MKYKYCGNCKHFKNEDVEGWGTCEFSQITRCDDICNFHALANNGWTEITKDNQEEVSKIAPERLIIAVIFKGKAEYKKCTELFWDIPVLAELGGYYYYELPELKLE